MRYTPRQMSGWLDFGSASHRQDMIDQIGIGALAARGDPSALTAQIEELEDE